MEYVYVGLSRSCQLEPCANDGLLSCAPIVYNLTACFGTIKQDFVYFLSAGDRC